MGHNAITIGGSSIVLGNAAITIGGSSIVLGNAASASSGGYDSIVLGNNASVNAHSSIVLGNNVSANSSDSIVLGNNASANGGISAIVLGNKASVNTFYSIALGDNASANGGNFSIALGDNASANGAFSIALGDNASTGGNGSIALGHNANASGYYSVAIGYGAKAINNIAAQITYTNSGGYGTNSVSISKGGTGWEFNSDERIKENIELGNTTLCLENINKVPVKRYTFKKFAAGYADRHQLGFIAQDLEKVYPKLVFDCGTEEFNNPDNSSEKIKIDNFKRIEREPLIPVLWGGVQELTKIIEQMQKRIDILEEKISKFDGSNA